MRVVTGGGNEATVAAIVRAQNAAVREVAYYLALPGMHGRLDALVADDALAVDDGLSLLEALRREAAASAPAANDA